MSNVLVTGGAGFIGSHVCDRLLARKDNVICLDNFNDYYDIQKKRDNIKHNLISASFHLEEIDIMDFDKLKTVFQKYKIDKIVHLAARAGVRPSLKEPKLYADVNILGTVNLLELAKTFEIETFIFGSSSSVYGTNEKVPFSEGDQIENQISPYAVTKRCGELICKSYSSISKLNITCLRFFTVYGPRGRPDMAPYKFTDLIYNNRPIEMYGDGKSKRDYTYIEDITIGILSALDKNFKFEIINLGNSNPIELNKFINLIGNILNKDVQIIKKPVPNGDVLLTFSSISKAKNLLGYNPKTNITEGMGKLVDWYIKQKSSS